MLIGAIVRNMGDQSTPEIMGACARAAEEVGLESVWVVDHIAIPPDDAEGSGGRYVDPLISLAWLAGVTSTVRLGVGVLILPYRPALPVAKQIASLQELSGERLLLGAGIGWMDAEFRALGVERGRRGRIADETLGFLRGCFENDEITANGQPFLFRPRPARPPIYVGGRPPHALERAATYGDGWMPMRMTPERLPAARAEYAEHCASAGREEVGDIVVVGELPLDDPGAAARTLDGFNEGGAARFVLGGRYADAGDFRRRLEALQAATERAGL